MEAVDVLFDVDSVLVFAFVVLFYVFGTVSDVAGLHLVGGGGVSADAAGVLVDVVTWFLEGFAAVLRLPN